MFGDFSDTIDWKNYHLTLNFCGQPVYQGGISPKQDLGRKRVHSIDSLIDMLLRSNSQELKFSQLVPYV